MASLDNFPKIESEYNPQKFMREFLLMDAALGVVESAIKHAMSQGDVEEISALFVEKKKMIEHMKQYVAEAYYASSGTVKLCPIFKKYELNFPYRGSGLWKIITNEAPREDDEEQNIKEILKEVAAAVTLEIDKS
jgi:hypothetical protein